MPILERIKFSEKGSIYVYKDKLEDKSLLELLKETSEQDYKRLNQLLEIMCTFGRITNKRHFKKYDDHIWGFKTHNYRILNFMIPQKSPLALVLLLFFEKCPNKEYPPKVKIANNLRLQILSEIANHTLEERN